MNLYIYTLFLYLIVKMFKQAQQRMRQQTSYRIFRKEEEGRVPELPIRDTTQSMEQNKVNLHNRGIENKIEPASTAKSQQKSKGATARGIQVTSRPSSRERKGLATSRSRQTQKQSREIKSQTNVSQFQPYVQSKEPSISDHSQKDQAKVLCLKYQQKMREMMLKNQTSHQLQLEQLKQIIESNDDRINNLIISLDALIDKNDKKQKLIDRLQSRLDSISNYNQQCYEYTLTRCQNIQTIFRVIADQVQTQKIDKQKIEDQLKKFQLIMKDVFVIQRLKNKHIMEEADNQLAILSKMTRRVEEQVRCLMDMNTGREKFRKNQDIMENYLQEMRDELKKQSQLVSAPSLLTSPNKINISNQFQHLLEKLKQKLEKLQQKHKELTQSYTIKQEKAQQSIYELSSLLNQHERQLQKKKKEAEEQLKYNIEIENRLIESKLKENSMRIEMDSLCKGLQSSKMEQCGLLVKEKQSYKQKFQELFRRSQYLQEINSKNKILLIRQQKQIETLTKKLQKSQRHSYQHQKLKNQLKLKEDYWSNRLKLETSTLQLTIATLKKENDENSIKLKQNSNQILLLETELKNISNLKNKLEDQYQKLHQGYTELQKQFQEEQLFSEHLEHQNEQLNLNLNQCNAIFQNQSQMFKNTIDKLKNQNHQLHKNLQTQAETIFASQPKKYECNRITFGPVLSRSSSEGQEIPRKITQLMKSLAEMGLVMPVLSQIDTCGYLKSCEKGTFIYDPEGNPYELNSEEKEYAVKNKVIELFQ